MFVVLNEEKYVVGLGDTPIVINGNESIECDLPDDFDYNQMCCYKYLGEKLVFDKNMKAQLNQLEQEFEQEITAKLQAEETYKRLMAQFLAQNASPEDAESLSLLFNK